LNCPGQIVISGKKAMVEEAVKACQELGKRAVPLDVSGAFHSSCMNSACRRIAEALTKIQVSTPRFAVISNLTAQAQSDPVQIRKNLVDQMNHRTLWEDSCRTMIGMGVRKFYELGPGKVLKGLMRKIDSSVQVVPLGCADDFKALEAGGVNAAQK
jgi:[acyl-carrier-protein] S-malonyltransferase